MLVKLPEEIQINILSRLPIETLVRCICVSKSLRSLLTSQTFIDAHIKQTNFNHLLLRYYSKDKERLFFLQPDDESFHGEFSESVEFPLESDDESYSILGSINGVICLSYKYYRTVLWNPSIRKGLSIPNPQELVGMDGDCETAMGFGFDLWTNDYRLIHIVYRGRELPPKVEVYSVSSRSWRPSEGSVPTCRVSDAEDWQCFLNGVVHWVGRREPDGYFITTFGVHDEVFGEMVMPDSLAKAYFSATYVKLDTCGDTLASVAYHVYSHTCSAWIMKEYGKVDSWTQIYCIDLQNLIPCGAFGFRHNEEIIMLVVDEDCRHLVLLVDYNRSEIEVLEMLVGESYSFLLGKYVKSLALFKEGNSDALDWVESEDEE